MPELTDIEREFETFIGEITGHIAIIHPQMKGHDLYSSLELAVEPELALVLVRLNGRFPEFLSHLEELARARATHAIGQARKQEEAIWAEASEEAQEQIDARK